jgi:hypothetical protein
LKRLVSIKALVCLTLFSTTVGAQVSDEARAHIKCFANLSKGLFTVKMRDANPKLERQRQRHEESFMEIGRRDLQGTQHRFGIDHYLGGYEQRVYDSQSQKIYCDNPSHYGHCDAWVSSDVSILSQVGMKFYERENCGLLLR